MSKIVVFEGFPGCGKTSLINLLALKSNMAKVPEILDQGNLWKNARESEDQNFFWFNDVAKMRLAKRSINRITLVDRGYASTMAYNYAKSIFEDDKKYLDILGKYYKDIVDKNLVANTYIYLKLPISKTFERKGRTVKKGDPWRDPSYLKEIEMFYDMFFKEIEKDAQIFEFNSLLSLDNLYIDVKQALETIS